MNSRQNLTVCQDMNWAFHALVLALALGGTGDFAARGWLTYGDQVAQAGKPDGGQGGQKKKKKNEEEREEERARATRATSPSSSAAI